MSENGFVEELVSNGIEHSLERVVIVLCFGNGRFQIFEITCRWAFSCGWTCSCWSGV